MGASFRIDQFAEFGDWLERGMADGLRRGLASAAFRTLGVIQNEIIPAENPKPVDRGAYRAAWHVEITAEGVDIVNKMPYASIIEWGARAENIKIGKAMIDALTEWVLRKGLSPKTGVNPENAARQMAWAIAVSMQKKGIFNRNGNQGLRIGEKAVKRLKGFLQGEIAREIDRKLQ